MTVQLIGAIMIGRAIDLVQKNKMTPISFAFD
jgi:hypothetical protein